MVRDKGTQTGAAEERRGTYACLLPLSCMCVCTYVCMYIHYLCSQQKALLEILTAADVIAATTTTASPDGVLK